MKLVKKIQSKLLDHYKQVLVFDERGDGHFVQIICVDVGFEGKSLLVKSREIFTHLGNEKSKVHALSVKGFTPAEWEVKSKDFELIKYQHYPKS